jgi:hypothetical protein
MIKWVWVAMSRAAIYESIVGNENLNVIGIDEHSVFHNYTLEERPIDSGPFMILRWGEVDRPPFNGAKSPVRLTIWMHWPLEETNDFSKIDKAFDICDDIFIDLNNVAGVDGYTVTSVRSTGRSGDLKDDGFQTITKNAGYEVLSRRS